MSGQGFAEVFGRDLRPELGDRRLDFRAHFAVVHPHPARLVEPGTRRRVHLRREEPLHLFDAAFVRAASLHDLVKDGYIQGHDGNRGTRLSHQRLVDRDEGAAASWGELGVDGLGRALQESFLASPIVPFL